MSLAIRRRRAKDTLSQEQQKLSTVESIIRENETVGGGDESNAKRQNDRLFESAEIVLPRLPRFLEMNSRLMIEALRMPPHLGSAEVVEWANDWVPPAALKTKPENEDKTRAALIRYYYAVDAQRQ